MISFSNILFPVDLSESSPIIAPYVTSLAEKLNASIHLLTVVRDFSYFASLAAPDNMVSIATQEIIDLTMERLIEFKEEHFSTFENTKYLVVYGDIPESILKYAKAHEIDIIVMGTHGRKGLEKIVFGSVTERIVKSSPIPVLTMTPQRLTEL